jgi:PAS domain S-box-containing protein
MDSGFTILTIEDNPSDLFLLEHMLRSSGLEIRKFYSAGKIRDAYALLAEHEIDVVLLDLTLPDSFGIHSFIYLKPMVQKIPVIILTGMSDTNVALEAIKEGAQDYLVKGELTEGLLAKAIQYSMERKRTLEHLRVSNERFNMVVKATNDAIWDRDLLTGRIFMVGDTYKQLFGYDFVNVYAPEDLWESLIHPEDRRRVLDKLATITMDGALSNWEDEYRLRKSNGEYAYVHDRGYIIYSADRRPVRMIGSLQDITARKRSEETIMASEEKYRQIFYKNPYPAWIFDLETLLIMEVNDAALKKYGFSKHEFCQLTMRDLHQEGEAELFLDPILAAFGANRRERQNGNGRERPLWHHIKRSGDIMIVEITSHRIEYFGKQCMQVIVNDVTDRVRLEKELALQQRLKQQQITEVVLGTQERERFELGQELHDNINQILATSKLYLDVAIEEQEPRIELLVKSRNNISMAIEEIRRLSKELISPSLQDLGLIQSMRELIRSIQMVNKMKIRLSLTGLDEHNLLPEQKINIYRIIQEQLNNILKHAQATAVTIDLRKEKEQICLRIEDDGKGFDPSARRMGVGISNIISRAELYNGKVEIDSSPGNGCRLEVILNSKAMPEERG